MVGTLQLMMCSSPLQVAPSASSVTSSGSTKSTHVMGSITLVASAGTGSYTYGAATLVSGSSSAGATNVTCAQSGNVYTFSAVVVSAGVDTVLGTWRLPVTDGATTVNTDVIVQWN